MDAATRTVLCRYATEFGTQPVQMRQSQGDWYRPKDWSLDAIRRDIGKKSPYFEGISKCKLGSEHRDEKGCHSIKESDPELVGKKWASLVSTNLTYLGITTYNEFFDKQVRSIIELVDSALPHAVLVTWLPSCCNLCRAVRFQSG
jgi:hypothetical protein